MREISNYITDAEGYNTTPKKLSSLYVFVSRHDNDGNHMSSAITVTDVNKLSRN